MPKPFKDLTDEEKLHLLRAHKEVSLLIRFDEEEAIEKAADQMELLQQPGNKERLNTELEILSLKPSDQEKAWARLERQQKEAKLVTPELPIVPVPQPIIQQDVIPEPPSPHSSDSFQLTVRHFSPDQTRHVDEPNEFAARFLKSYNAHSSDKLTQEQLASIFQFVKDPATQDMQIGRRSSNDAQAGNPFIPYMSIHEDAQTHNTTMGIHPSADPGTDARAIFSALEASGNTPQNSVVQIGADMPENLQEAIKAEAKIRGFNCMMEPTIGNTEQQTVESKSTIPNPLRTEPKSPIDA